MLKDKPATYVANVRVSIKHLAAIATFYNSQGEHKGTLSKLASAIIITGAELAMESFPIASTTEAVEILQNLGYEDFLKPSAKHKISLFKALGTESKQKITQSQNMQHIKNIMTAETKIIKPNQGTLNVLTTTRKPQGMTTEEAAELSVKETQDIKNLRKELEI